MTSEGGGAVAFPVMTLAFSILPSVARDFSVMIQSCGMSAASFTILFMRIRCEWRALAFSSLGGLIGLILGLEIIDDLIHAEGEEAGFREHLVCLRFRFALPDRFPTREDLQQHPGIQLVEGSGSGLHRMRRWDLQWSCGERFRHLHLQRSHSVVQG